MSFDARTSRRQLVRGVALLGCALATAPAARGAIVNIDVSTFNGVNAGMSYGDSRTITNFVPGWNLDLYFRDDYVGLAPGGYSNFMFADDDGDAVPHNFAAGSDVSAWSVHWSAGPWRTLFYAEGDLSPDFGPGSFIGFRFGDGANWNYGWIEVTWTWGGSPEDSTFQILGAAYESTVNTAILAGATGVIPLPGAAGLAACGLLGLGRRRRR